MKKKEELEILELPAITKKSLTLRDTKYLQWREKVEASCISAAKNIERLRPVPPPSGNLENLLNVYTLTDCHVGMLAWHRENLSSDWDLRIAEKTLLGCMDLMVKTAPKARHCVLAQLGDYLHADSMAAITPTHGHLLDVDNRYSKAVEIAVDILKRAIRMALEHHETVTVLAGEGNHDPSSSIWLRTLLSTLYEDEPRVRVIDTVIPYYCISYGDVMLGWHHGHLTNPSRLPLLFAAQYPIEWGRAKRRYIHCGHRHHLAEVDHTGATVVQHPTLAERDSYASRGGWMSSRRCMAITYHIEHGEINRTTIVPEMIVSV